MQDSLSEAFGRWEVRSTFNLSWDGMDWNSITNILREDIELAALGPLVPAFTGYG